MRDTILELVKLNNTFRSSSGTSEHEIKAQIQDLSLKEFDHTFNDIAKWYKMGEEDQDSLDSVGMGYENKKKLNDLFLKLFN